MRQRDLMAWMWGDALSLLEQAERLQRQFCSAATTTRAWEPPVDVVESEDAMYVHVALPGVPPSQVMVSLEPGGITVSGVRSFPAAAGALRIHRIEIPYGRFERRIALPLHALEPVARELSDGCLVLTFRKIKERP